MPRPRKRHYAVLVPDARAFEERQEAEGRSLNSVFMPYNNRNYACSMPRNHRNYYYIHYATFPPKLQITYIHACSLNSCKPLSIARMQKRGYTYAPVHSYFFIVFVCLVAIHFRSTISPTLQAKCKPAEHY